MEIHVVSLKESLNSGGLYRFIGKKQKNSCVFIASSREKIWVRIDCIFFDFYLRGCVSGSL